MSDNNFSLSRSLWCSLETIIDGHNNSPFHLFHYFDKDVWVLAYFVIPCFPYFWFIFFPSFRMHRYKFSIIHFAEYDFNYHVNSNVWIPSSIKEMLVSATHFSSRSLILMRELEISSTSSWQFVSQISMSNFLEILYWKTVAHSSGQ